MLILDLISRQVSILSIGDEYALEIRVKVDTPKLVRNVDIVI